MILIEGSVEKCSPYEAIILRLKTPVENKELAVVRYDTIGYSKLSKWKTGDSFSMEIKYRVGPDAILIKEIY